jgi:hypothetical protein
VSFPTHRSPSGLEHPGPLQGCVACDLGLITPGTTEITPTVVCAYPPCPERGPRGESDGRPTPPAGWYEVEIREGNRVRIYLCCSNLHGQAVAAGYVKPGTGLGGHRAPRV